MDRAMLLDVTDPETIRLVHRYLEVLDLPSECLRVTTDKRAFEAWLGRRISSAAGGAYVHLPGPGEHAVFINLRRIDRSRPRSLEIVVAEELIHYRDALDGDRRRHWKHGYDRIAIRVAALTGASLEDVRSALLPTARRPLRYRYQCPSCRRLIWRRLRGTWSCGRCSPRFDRRFVLQLVADSEVTDETTLVA
jgi:hypothetical protein